MGEKLSGRDAEIAALQSDSSPKSPNARGNWTAWPNNLRRALPTRRKSKRIGMEAQGRKEVAERQLTTRQKEIHAIENEIHRAKAQRDQDLLRKTASSKVKNKN